MVPQRQAVEHACRRMRAAQSMAQHIGPCSASSSTPKPFACFAHPNPLQALSVLVLGINSRLDGALAEMLRMRWDAIEAPGDDSYFVTLARKVRHPVNGTTE